MQVMARDIIGEASVREALLGQRYEQRCRHGFYLHIAAMGADRPLIGLPANGPFGGDDGDMAGARSGCRGQGAGFDHANHRNAIDPVSDRPQSGGRCGVAGND
jgi:hypothetical protein